MKKLSFVAFLIALFVGVSFAGVPPMIPNTYVQDHANVLTPEDEAQIQDQLNQLKLKYNLEFGVATVETTEPRVIAEYALEMARTYGIGAKDGEKRGIHGQGDILRREVYHRARLGQLTTADIKILKVLRNEEARLGKS